MKREAVKSSMFKSAGYDPATKTLELEFNSGEVYRYRDVSPAKAAAFAASHSKGQFFAFAIREQHSFAKA